MSENTLQRLADSLFAKLQRQMNTGAAITTTTVSNNQANTERLSQPVLTERRKKKLFKDLIRNVQAAIIQIINHNNSLDEDKCEAKYNNIEGLANRIISTLAKLYSQDESTKVYPDYWANLHDNKKQNAIDDLNAIVRQKYNIPFDECEVDCDPESLPTSSTDNPINKSVSNLASSASNTINESDEPNPAFFFPRETIAAVPEIVPTSSLSDRTNLSVTLPNNPAITQPTNIGTASGSSNGGRGRGRGRGRKRATRLVESITAHQDTINPQQKRPK
ncbi:hypothetical protein BDC45DRAFT_531945 [Circinella umbellata]|nr:hypothetical protein BDC45DRAFT_531945 [Circinella umbellata]